MTNWLQTSAPGLDYANAMVASAKDQQRIGAGNPRQQHVTEYRDQFLPTAPAKLTASLWFVGSQPNCDKLSNLDRHSRVFPVEDLHWLVREIDPQVCWPRCSGSRFRRNGTVRHIPAG